MGGEAAQGTFSLPFRSMLGFGIPITAMNNFHKANSQVTHVDLQAMAKQIMIEYGFEPDFPPAVTAQMAKINTASPAASANSRNVRDMRNLLWSSIDNDTSRDLDQIEVADRMPSGEVKVMVGIA